MYMIENEEGLPVGVCGLTDIDLVNRRAEFSLYIGPEYHGCGYGEASLRALIKKGFNSYGLKSIWGESFTGNMAMKMFYKVGFKHDGVRRSFYFRDGKFIDAHLFSILRDEWKD
jgi:ribosomal-protein-serine acetyltransferase